MDLFFELGTVLKLALIMHYELSEPQIRLILLNRQSRFGLMFGLDLDQICLHCIAEPVHRVKGLFDRPKFRTYLFGLDSKLVCMDSL